MIFLRTNVSADEQIKNWINKLVASKGAYKSGECPCPKCPFEENKKDKKEEKSCNNVEVKDGGVLAGHFDYYFICHSKDVESLEDFILNCVRQQWARQHWGEDIIVDSQTVVGISYSKNDN